ncbi:MAG: hypothetical protein D4Q79_00700 [Spirochaetia bacterium]|nr:MAG: hypothetical protein D4Q79_00700 [Spirochaetia bacterium]
MLIRCPECTKNVSSSADKCPHCGYPDPYTKSSEVKKLVKQAREKSKDRIVKCPNCDRDNTPDFIGEDPMNFTGKLTLTVFYKCAQCNHVYSKNFLLE